MKYPIPGISSTCASFILDFILYQWFLLIKSWLLVYINTLMIQSLENFYKDNQYWSPGVNPDILTTVQSKFIGFSNQDNPINYCTVKI
jgi:hypothetical protein